MRPPQRMPYHKSTAEIVEPQPMTHNQAQAFVNGWRPKQPALFALNEVIDCPVAVFGRLPRGFLTKVALPMLRCPRQEVLHVCSGALREKYTVDIRPEVKPWLVADGAHLPLSDDSFAAVLLDPPYVPAWARQYGTKYPPTYPLLREAARVVKGGGRIGILHFLVPFPPKGTRLVKVFGVSVGMGYQMRAFTVYEKEASRK
jgi:SAM-dependent methyltransferase